MLVWNYLCECERKSCPQYKLTVAVCHKDYFMHLISLIYLLWSEAFWEAVIGCTEMILEALKNISMIKKRKKKTQLNYKKQ